MRAMWRGFSYSFVNFLSKIFKLSTFSFLVFEMKIFSFLESVLHLDLTGLCLERIHTESCYCGEVSLVERGFHVYG